MLFTLCLFAFSHLSAQSGGPALTLEDIYKNHVYHDKGFGPIRWSNDGKGYLTLETGESGKGNEIIKYDAKTGAKSIVCSSGMLTPEGADKPLHVADYQWSHDNGKLLIFTNTRRVWRLNTRGDYWLLDLKSGNLRQLGKTVKPTTMMFAKFSPDDSRVAYVSENNIYVEDLRIR